MNKLVLNFALLAALSAGLSAHAQKKKEVINDSNTPLHLLQPDYQVTRVRDKDCVKNRVKRAKIVRFTLC